MKPVRSKKQFSHGDYVKVALPKNHPKGGGIGYRVRYVTKVRRRSRDIASRSVR